MFAALWLENDQKSVKFEIHQAFLFFLSFSFLTQERICFKRRTVLKTDQKIPSLQACFNTFQPRNLTDCSSEGVKIKLFTSLYLILTHSDTPQHHPLLIPPAHAESSPCTRRKPWRCSWLPAPQSEVARRWWSSTGRGAGHGTRRCLSGSDRGAAGRNSSASGLGTSPPRCPRTWSCTWSWWACSSPGSERCVLNNKKGISIFPLKNNIYIMDKLYLPLFYY